MASFDAINYSTRPSKTIQRHIVFEGVRRMLPHLDLDNLAYVGFGSIWFTDFVAAHKMLGVNDMISIEADAIGYSRAKFNLPYATVRVLHGASSKILPTLRDDEILRGRPWMVWLDYDGPFEESVMDDLRWVVENAPQNSILVVSANGHEMTYGAAPDRVERLRDIFGSVVPDDLPKNACKEDRMQQTLADLALNFLRAIAADLARPGGFVPSFRVVYRDGAPMVTVGGVLPAKGAAGIARDMVAQPEWRGLPDAPILAPHLTLRETASLQSLLPGAKKLTRDSVRALGFDLDDEQITAFERYYKLYPSFVQIAS